MASSTTKWPLNRDVAHVQRWHTMPHIHQESVLEHSAAVARLGYELATILSAPGIHPDRIMASALYHDDLEVITGDVPGDFKPSMPLGTMAALEELAMSSLNITSEHPLQEFLVKVTTAYALSPAERDLLRYADLLAAYAYCSSEVELGNRFAYPVMVRVWEDLELRVTAQDVIKELYSRQRSILPLRPMGL